MAKFTIEFPMTIRAVELIEADSREDAQRIAERLVDSWEFFCERLYPDYKDVDTHEHWDDCGVPIVGREWPGCEPTLTKEQIEDFIGG